MRANFSQLSTKDLATLSQRTITISDEPAFAVVNNHPLLNALKAEDQLYDEVYAKKKSSGKSLLLSDAKENREAPFGGLKLILKGHIRASGSPYQQAAKEIYAIVEKYGIGLYRFKYAEETAQLKKLLEELDQPENVGKIDFMQLTPIINQIKDAHVAFESLFNQIAGENAELHLLESATSQRKALENALKNYYSLVTAMKSLPEWRELYAKLDEVVKAANNNRPKPPKTDTPPAE